MKAPLDLLRTSVGGSIGICILALLAIGFVFADELHAVADDAPFYQAFYMMAWCVLTSLLALYSSDGFLQSNAKESLKTLNLPQKILLHLRLKQKTACAKNLFEAQPDKGFALLCWLGFFYGILWFAASLFYAFFSCPSANDTVQLSIMTYFAAENMRMPQNLGCFPSAIKIYQDFAAAAAQYLMMAAAFFIAYTHCKAERRTALILGSAGLALLCAASLQPALLQSPADPLHAYQALSLWRSGELTAFSMRLSTLGLGGLILVMGMAYLIAAAFVIPLVGALITVGRRKSLHKKIVLLFAASGLASTALLIWIDLTALPQAHTLPLLLCLPVLAGGFRGAMRFEEARSKTYRK